MTICLSNGNEISENEISNMGEAHMVEESKMNEKDAFYFFKKNMDDARQTLRLLRLDEVWEDIQSMRPLSRFRPMPIRKLLKERSEKVYELVLPQIIVFGVASLDAFLKMKYEQLSRFKQIAEDEGKRRNEKTIFQETGRIRNKFGELVKKDIFRGDEKLKEDLQKVFGKRHVIAHRAGVIDDDYCEKHKLDKSWINRKLPLDVETVENDLTTIEKFGDIANKIIGEVMNCEG